MMPTRPSNLSAAASAAVADQGMSIEQAPLAVEMAAFDRLPKDLRDLLNYSVETNFSALDAWDDRLWYTTGQIAERIRAADQRITGALRRRGLVP